MTKMWKIYLVGIALFPCLYYVFCDTSSDDGPYRSPFDTELLQILRQISTNLNVISENTERNWNLQFNAEMNKIKVQNRKLKNNLKKILNETATEKKRAQDMGAEITNIKQEIRKLKNDLHDILSETAIEKKRAQDMGAEITNIKQENRKLKNDLHEIQNETAIEKKRAQDMGAEITNIKQENRKLKNDLHEIQNETAIEKKRAQDMGAEMTNIKQEIITLKNDLDKTLNVTASDKNRSQEMDKILHEKFKELKNLTLNLRKGSITANNQFRIDQKRINKNILKRLQTLEGRSNTHEVFVNNSLKGIMLGVDSLNASLLDIDRKLKPKVIDCGDLKDSDISLHDGVYKIYPDRSEEVSVYCDMDDGGWTVFQKRINGNTDFYRGWNEYRDGFGNPTEEYWLGNKYLHILTRNRTCTLKIEMVNIKNITGHATYINFQIASEVNNFKLRIGRYSGNAGHDSLRIHNNREFSTKDRDHDANSDVDCAVYNKGAWWYDYCAFSNLNGEYGRRDNKGVVWGGYPLSDFMKATTMKIKCT